VATDRRQEEAEVVEAADEAKYPVFRETLIGFAT